MIIKVIFWLCVGLFLYALILITLTNSNRKEITYEDILKKRQMEEERRLSQYPKKIFGRCGISVGKYGFDVSNPIRVKDISDQYIGNFLNNTLYRGQEIIGFTAVSVCRCRIIWSPVYRYAVKLKHGEFLTLFFVEDGETAPIRYYPSGFYRKPSGKGLVNDDSNIRYSLKISEEQKAETYLIMKECTQTGLPILRESILQSTPVRRNNDTQETFNQKKLRAAVKNRLMREYWEFIKRKND